ncbi:hypothetical protein FXO37_16201 [Capsicum annuum]|nr:hypothetical protein FXO37_16201 [Capsicum annuum]
MWEPFLVLQVPTPSHTASASAKFKLQLSKPRNYVITSSAPVRIGACAATKTNRWSLNGMNALVTGGTRAVSKKHYDVNNFFDILGNVLNIAGGSFKRREMLRDDQAEKLEELLLPGEVHTGSGLNQEHGLQRSGDTHWVSHFKTICNFVSLFSSIVHLLRVFENEDANYHEKAMAKSLVEDIKSFKFIYMLHFMLKILAVTYDLNMALQ